MRVAVIRPPNRDDVINMTFYSREWEEYEENGRDISTALQTLGHEAHILREGRQLPHTLEQLGIDVAWVCSAGGQGCDPTCHLPSVLEMVGIPYVGSGPLAAGLADSKPAAKLMIAGSGIRTPDGTSASPEDAVSMDIESWPRIIKPSHGFGGCGVYLARTRSELITNVRALHQRYRDRALIEEYIEGVDVTVPILEVSGRPTPLPPLQRFFLWRTIMTPNESDEYLPEHQMSTLLEKGAQRLPAEYEPEQCAEAATAVFRALGLRHFARIDFRLGHSGLFFLEANSKPDLRIVSLYMTSARLVGWEYESLIDHLLNEALAGNSSTPNVERRA